MQNGETMGRHRSGVHAETCGEPLLSSPSRLQEAEKQSQALQQEVAELREELRARGSGGECPLPSYPGANPQLQFHECQGTPMIAVSI